MANNIITTTISQRLYVNGNSASVIQTSLGITYDGVGYELDFSQGNNFNITLSVLSSLYAVINATAGQSGVILLTQDSFGNHGMSFDSSWHFPNGNIPSLSTAANAVDALVYMVRVGGSAPIISCQLIQGI